MRVHTHTRIYIYLISNKLHRKKRKKIKRKKAHRQCARGNKATKKVHKSSISGKEMKVKTPEAFAQSSKV